MQSNDADSTFADSESGFWSLASSTQSVRSSVYDYEKLQGRTYHAFHAGKYHFPNDEDELDRMDIFYHALRLTYRNQLFFAPVTSPQAILDVGTGTGIWAMDAADAHPEAVVIGIDLSPTQPNYAPPNLYYEIADADEEWTFSRQFDLIHTRAMNDHSLKSWPQFLRRAFCALKPGGWVECQEFDYRSQSDDNTLPADGKLKVWEAEWTRGIRTVGMNGFCEPGLLVSQMREAGFVNVARLDFKLPIGPWPKDKELRKAGLFGMVNLLDGMHGLSAKLFTGALGYGSEELEILLMHCREQVRNRKIHGYMPV